MTVRVGPLLEHKYNPKPMLFVYRAIEVRLPHLSDRFGAKIAFIAEAPFIEELLRPFAKGASKPAADRHAEAHLGPLNQLPGHMPVEQLAKKPFGRATPQTIAKRKAPSELYQVWI